LSEPGKGIALEEVLEFVRGRLLSGRPGQAFSRVITDSRTAGPGDLFVALRGERFDGHDFIEDTLRRGAAGVLAQMEVAAEVLQRHAAAVIQVPDTLRALGDLAGGWRRKFDTLVAVLTGSNGKTTTKEMAVSILNLRFRCLWSPGNFNNRIGLPLTLLNLGPEHERALLEMGMNEPGEIRTLTAICRPQAGALLNIGPAHLGKFPSLEDIARAKAEMLEAMPRDAVLIYNRDDSRVKAIAAGWRGPRTSFGLDPGADISALDVREHGMRQAFRLVIRDEEIPAEVGVPGAHNMLNALAAAALARTLGAPAEAIREGLARFQGIAGRFVVHEREGFTLVDDSYNANPRSMKAALDTLAKVSGQAPRILVLGDMLELGEFSAEAHLELGRQAGRLVPALLCVAGEFGGWVERGARESGLEAEHIGIFDDPAALAARLLARARGGEWILVKGSHGMALERVVKALLDGSHPRPGGIS
jgi:UDP-N-acetylmuramoyl-tripeptide--D-alanyl-D-alanine ligase